MALNQKKYSGIEHPINCRECGRVLFKSNSEDFSTGNSSMLIFCKCGALQRVMSILVPKINVETVKTGSRRSP